MLCLAWDDLKKIPRWCWFAAPVVCIIGMLKPALWFVIVPALVLWLFSRH
jgi:hypothetical protein